MALIKHKSAFCRLVRYHVNIFNTQFHGQETRDHTASFPFLKWRPPLRLIEQLGDIFLGISALI